jgi:CRP-like cAMP-binding protein
MNNRKTHKTEPREILALAERAVSLGDTLDALRFFDACIQEYLKRGMPFKAIAVAKRARSILGPIPKVRSLIIRLYSKTGLYGDARQEYLLAASAFKRDEIPLFKDLDEEAFLDVLSVMEIVPAPKGRTVLKQHQKGEDVFVVLSGTLEVIRDSRSLSTLGTGDVFGELGFFCQGNRSATIKAIEKSILIRIPSEPLKELRARHPRIRDILENLYGERILKKTREDLGDLSPAPGRQDIIATLTYPKGREIPMNSPAGIAIVKYGIVEIDYDDMKLRRKGYVKAGSIIPHGTGRAKANTNVVILLTRMHR